MNKLLNSFSVGSAFLWRKPYQKSIRQLCCPPTKEEALEVMSAPAAAPDVMSAPAAAPGVMSAPAAAPDIMFVDHTLSLVVKLKGPDRITGLKLHVSYDSASEDNIENADQNMRVEIIELTKKRPNSEFGVPKELIYVGSVELGKLLTNTSYIGRFVT